MAGDWEVVVGATTHLVGGVEKGMEVELVGREASLAAGCHTHSSPPQARHPTP